MRSSLTGSHPGSVNIGSSGITFIMINSRQALHVGNLDFPNEGDVYFSMINVFMDDGREDIELCLENYKTLIYDGNFDIICNHSGVLDMIADLSWSGADAYRYTMIYSTVLC